MHVCTVCGHTETVEEYAALGHKFGDLREIQSASCISEG